MVCNIHLSQTYWKRGFQGRVFGAGVWSKSKPHSLNKLNYSPGIALGLVFIFLVRTNALYALSIPSLEIP